MSWQPRHIKLMILMAHWHCSPMAYVWPQCSALHWHTLPARVLLVPPLPAYQLNGKQLPAYQLKYGLSVTNVFYMKKAAHLSYACPHPCVPKTASNYTGAGHGGGG
ncbi:hypothetical protein COO60DRAFT_77495 [Scenedesmus sp. NREL 46B-D3]|nr:hypothetical protein COO60DRAFT_77495 [Scenedesmus sp. NREL 46B-D3]